MSIPGYDDWKLMTPEEGRGTICPFCGAWSTSQCEFEDDTECPWEDSEPDPDLLREMRDEVLP